MTDDEKKIAEQLRLDTESFLSSEYGKHIMAILNDMHEGYIANAENMNAHDPLRHFDKATAVKEIISMINSPLN